MKFIVGTKVVLKPHNQGMPHAIERAYKYLEEGIEYIITETGIDGIVRLDNFTMLFHTDMFEKAVNTELEDAISTLKYLYKFLTLVEKELEEYDPIGIQLQITKERQNVKHQLVKRHNVDIKELV